jgi:hypothetical protein
VGFGQQAYINAVLTVEMIQFLLLAADSVSIPAGHPQGFRSRRLSRPCRHIQLRKDDNFEHSV